VAGGLLVGWLVSHVVFDVWFNSVASESDCAAHPYDLQAGFGAAFFALPEAAILLCGVLWAGSPQASRCSRVAASGDRQSLAGESGMSV
jgi:hypothetical protein